MTIKLSLDQRFVIADCVRSALQYWLTTDPVVGPRVRGIEARCMAPSGLAWSRFADAVVQEIGATYHARSPATANVFPLTVAESVMLANDIELSLATDEQILAAALIASRSPVGQPNVGTRAWRSYIGALSALGLSIDDDRPDWRTEVHHLLAPMRRAVAAAHLEAAE